MDRMTQNPPKQPTPSRGNRHDYLPAAGHDAFLPAYDLLVRALGAHRVIDYTREDFTRGATKYDLIFQLAGTHSPATCRRALTPTGTLVQSSGDAKGRWLGPLTRILQAAVLSPFVSQNLAQLDAKRSQKDLTFLTELIEAGKLTPVIDRTYPLRETAEAIRYLETGRARGKVVIAV